MSNTKPRYGDLLSALLFVGLSIYVIAAAIPWGVYGIDGPGPGFFPIIYGVLMFVLGGALFWRAGRQPGPPNISAAQSTIDPEAPTKNIESTPAAFLTWLALALSIPLMMAVGFLVGFFLFAFFIIKVIFRRSWMKSAVSAAGISGGLYVLFHMLLDVDLPASMIWARLFGGE